MSFSAGYVEARDRFRSLALASGGKLEALEVCRHDDHGPLTIDVALFGREHRRCLVVSSGVHGIEGFAGSAIQADLMQSALPENLRVVLIHAVNPYGMACLRRANENNVDLNRNFLPPGIDYAGASEGYRTFYSILHPETPHRGIDGFLVRALFEVVRHGMPALRQAIAGGQYDYPKGLFWGGDGLQRGPALLTEHLPTWVGGSERSILIDVHTGLGPSGTHALLVDAEAGSPAHRRYRDAFGEHVQPLDPEQSVAYRISGAYAEGVRGLFPGEVELLTAEFGTRSPLRVIAALRAENRAHFWGGDVDGAKRALRAAFYPHDEAWRRSVRDGGQRILARAVSRLRGP